MVAQQNNISSFTNFTSFLSTLRYPATVHNYIPLPSCLKPWSGFDLFEPSVTIGRNCAVYRSDNSYISWLQGSCVPEVTTCSSAFAFCYDRYAESLRLYEKFGVISGTTSVRGRYHDAEEKLELSNLTTWMSPAVYDPPWKHIAKPPCCGPCSLGGGTFQVHVWPNSQASKNFKDTDISENQSESMSHILISDGFTL